MTATIDATILASERKRYLDGEITHHNYYLWLGREIGVTSAAWLPVSVDRIRKSTDPYLNDISLNNWDAKDPAVRQAAYAHRLPWAFSDTVCVLKALARHLAEVAS